MQLLSCHNGRLHAVNVAAWDGSFKTKNFVTGFPALDDLLPGGAFARGAVHELLALPNHPPPLFAALLLVSCAIVERDFQAAIVWCDPLRALYPPAVAAMGVSLDRLFLLHPKSIQDEN